MIPTSLASIPNNWLKYLPTDQEIDTYDEFGWHISPIMLPEDIIDSAIAGAKNFYEGKTDFDFNQGSGIADGDENSDSAIRNNEFVTLRKKELQTLGFHPLITASAAALARTNGIRLFADSLILKSPEKPSSKGIVGWHSDKAYWPTCTSDKMLTCWIPLQDCTIDMGPLVYLNKSHEWRNDDSLKNYFSFNNQNLSNFETHLKEHRPDYEKVPMVVKKGQVCFHNCHTIHSSFPNTSNKDRLALAMHFQDSDNAYKKAYKETGEQISISYDALCKKNSSGDPDYADENIFPLLFAKEGV